MRPGPRDNPPSILRPPSTLKVLGLASLLALTGELLALPWLIGLDDALWRAILHVRGCAWDQWVALATDVATATAILLLALASVASLCTVGLRATWPPLAVCAVGLLTGKVLKNFFARERPSIIAGAALGHSFPSAHVMNTALAALAIVLLTRHVRVLRRRWVVPSGLLIVNCSGRLLVAHHWLSDVVGALLAALVLTGLTLPAFRRRPLVAPGLVTLALAAVLSLDLGIRPLEIRLPSPLTISREAIAHVVTGSALGTASMRGSWSAATEGIRVLPSAAWLRGSGTIAIEVPERNDLDGGRRDTLLEPGVTTVLALAGRPDTTVPGCGALRVTVNGTPLRAFVPFTGWREYRLIVPAGTMHRGHNQVQIELADDGTTPRGFAVAYLRVVLR